MKLIPILLAALLVSACEGDTTIVNPTGPSAVPGGNNPGNPVVSTRIEFRVTGNANGVRVRYSNAIDGLTQVTTTLPYIASITTNEQSMFLSLEATPTSYNFNVTFPYMVVQIFADGKLFRESSSNDFFLNTLAVSGTWRK